MRLEKLLLRLSVVAVLWVSATNVYAEIPRYDFSNIIQTNYYGGIHSIARDADGLVWCCGHDAVLRYNGYDCVNITASLTALAPKDNWNFDNVVVAGGEKVFIGSNHGVLCYDKIGDCFEIVHAGNIGGLCSDEDSVLWMVCDGVPMSMDAVSLQYTSYEVDSEIPIESKHFGVFSAQSAILAAWNNHLAEFDKEGGKFRYTCSLPSQSPVMDMLMEGGKMYVLTQTDGLFCGNNGVFVCIAGPSLTTGAKKLYCDVNGIIWASSQSGILFYDPLHDELHLQSHNSLSPDSLPVSSVWDIYEDPRLGVWVSTYGGRLIYTDLSHSDMSYHMEGLPYPIVACFCQGPDQRIWLGTEGGGLAVMDSNSSSMKQLSTTDGLLSNYVKSLNYDGRGHIVVSTYNGGVQFVDAYSMRVGRTLVGGCQKRVSAYAVLPAAKGGYWLTSPDERVKYLGTDGSLKQYDFHPLGGMNVRTVEDLFRVGSLLYFVTAKGLFLVDENSESVVDVKLIPKADYNCNNLICYCRLSNGDILFGTNGTGVNILKTDGIYEKLEVNGQNPLSGMSVVSLLEDKDGQTVWICTEKGFYSYDLASREITEEPAVQLRGAAMHRSCFRDVSGTMYFGSTNGFVSFTPSTMARNTYKPKVFFSNVLLNSSKCTQKDLDNIKHNEVNLELELSCDSYLYTHSNRYAYKIEGLSNEWTVLPYGQHTIQVVNPRPGHYKLVVKAANNSGVWGDELSSLSFRVKPSPLASWWAVMLYCLVVFAIIAFAWFYITNRKLYEQRIKMEQERAEHSREQALARTKFLTNISHDLKTPLTLLEDPLRRMKEHLEPDSPMEKYVMSIDRNVHRISHMISQLLHFREIESQKLVLNNQENDFVRFTHDIFSLFEPLASQKNIEMMFQSQNDKLVMPFDHDVIEKLLSNLCSNAIKYTVTDGVVGLNISNDDNNVYLSVINTGTGIPEDKKNLIFGEFAKLPGQHPNFQSSTGLGLAIVKELISALGGTIELNSSDSRVEFALAFPYQKAQNKGYDTPYEYDYAVSEVDNLLNEYVKVDVTTHTTSRKANTVLIVEDDPQMRAYLESNLSDRFNVYTASDGVDAMTKADKVNPQVIITDLMMPEMDGFELCKRVREDIRISHISVIILSCLDNKEAKLKSMEAGANAFLGKPVDIEVLISQVETMIRTQENLREKYSKRFIAEPSKLTISSMDEKLLEKAMKCIEKNIDNFDYDVDAFVSDMAIGRTLMYRKIKDITGMSVKEFIMDIRLKRAIQLIKDSDYNISEISWMTGFINPKYFSVCFKRHFDMTPSEYKKKFL